MPLLHRRDEPAGTRYQMREKLFAIGDDFWIETEGVSERSRSTAKRYEFAAHSSSRARRGTNCSRSKKETSRPRHDGNQYDGHTVAAVKKALVTPLRDRFSIDLKDGGELSAKGNIVNHEYEIERDGDKIAEISKRWFRDPRHLRDRDRHRARTTR